jgi:hypothetical protein
MTNTAQILPGAPAGSLPPSERAGHMFTLEMIGDAFAVHDYDEETGESCCSNGEPCAIRRGLQKLMADTLAKLDGANTAPNVTTPEPIRPTNPNPGMVVKTAPRNLASDAQIRFIQTMATEQGKEVVTLGLTKQAASRLIDKLIAARDAARKAAKTAPRAETPAAPREAAKTPAAPRAEVTDGMYRTPDGDVYKVQIAKQGSGRLYAKKLVAREEPKTQANGKVITHEFAYETGAISRLTADMKMTLDEAQEWGRLYGTCCRCGAALTDEKSIADGIGPICKSRF